MWTVGVDLEELGARTSCDGREGGGRGLGSGLSGELRCSAVHV